jgi:serpin B
MRHTLSALVLVACSKDPMPPAQSPPPVATVAPDAAVANDLPTIGAGGSGTAPVAVQAPGGGYAARMLSAVKKSGNVVLGTSVIRDALQVATFGARGTTESELKAALDVANAPEATLKGLSFGEAKVLTANRAWVATPVALLPAYEKQVQAFGASVAKVDFAKGDSARTAINQWAAKETQDKIAELVPKGGVAADTQLVLTSAIYLKAAWETAFAPTGTVSEAFRGSSPVKMMHRTGSMLTANLQGSVLVELPYKGSTLVFDAVLPKDDTATVSLDALLAEAKQTSVYVGLPRIDAKTSAELSAPLRTLGIRAALSDAADFSGMTEKGKLRIGAVHTSSMLKVDENGTEAAAAAAAVMMPTGAPLKPLVVNFDRPFYAFIRDSKSGAILFAAWIEKPNGS